MHFALVEEAAKARIAKEEQVEKDAAAAAAAEGETVKKSEFGKILKSDTTV